MTRKPRSSPPVSLRRARRAARFQRLAKVVSSSCILWSLNELLVKGSSRQGKARVSIPLDFCHALKKLQRIAISNGRSFRREEIESRTCVLAEGDSNRG